MMLAIGEMTGKNERAEKLVTNIKRELVDIKSVFNNERVAYFIWKKPYMLAAGDTYIDHVMEYIGLKNVAAGMKRYPEITVERLKELNPDWCFLSSEPFPFKDTHCREIENDLPQTKAIIVDGEMFSWYGSRLQKLPGYIKILKRELLNE
jgi:ABC-type Fe3+-hydroxamate transport system substrate-binding protein